MLPYLTSQKASVSQFNPQTAEAQLPRRKCNASGHRAGPTEATGANGFDWRLVEAGPGRKGMVKAGVWGQNPLTKRSRPCYLHEGEEATKGSSGGGPITVPAKGEGRREMTATD